MECHGAVVVKGHCGATTASREHHGTAETEECHGVAEAEEHCSAAAWSIMRWQTCP